MRIIEEFDTKTQQLSLIVGRVKFMSFKEDTPQNPDKPGELWNWVAKDRRAVPMAMSSVLFKTRHQSEKAMRKFIEGMR